MITLTTDFGYQDHYVAVMKAIIYQINPNAKIVDITHGVQRHSIRHAAYILRCILPYFENAVHVSVIDPGVGTERRSIAAKLTTGWFVGPDNGILTLVKDEVEEVYEIEIGVKSNTFHGRDIFAPAAARIDLGDISFLHRIEDFVTFPYGEAKRKNSEIEAYVIHVDHFGNVITNVPADMVRDAREINFGEKTFRFLKSYGYASPKELIALINSENLLEFGVNQGSAWERLRLSPGDKITLKILH